MYRVMLIQRVKKAIDSFWVRYKAFRVIFITIFIFSIFAVSIYAFMVFRFFFIWSFFVFFMIYVAKKYRAEPAGFRRKYWWLPLALTGLSMFFFSYLNYVLGKMNYFMFSAALCLISIGCLIYYSIFKREQLICELP